MKEEIKQAVEIVSTHPKTTVAITTFFTSHVWINYGEPMIKAATSVIGLCVLVALLIKHVLDIKNALSGKDDKFDD
jgi:ABC-type sulfate transport system permease subunit